MVPGYLTPVVFSFGNFLWALICVLNNESFLKEKLKNVRWCTERLLVKNTNNEGFVFLTMSQLTLKIVVYGHAGLENGTIHLLGKSFSYAKINCKDVCVCGWVCK